MKTKAGSEVRGSTADVDVLADAIQGMAPEISPRTAEALAQELVSLVDPSADLINGNIMDIIPHEPGAFNHLGVGAERFRERLLERWSKGRSDVEFAALVPPMDRDFMDALFALSTIDLDRPGLDAEEVQFFPPVRPVGSGQSPLDQFYFIAPAVLLVVISIVSVLL